MELDLDFDRKAKAEIVGKDAEKSAPQLRREETIPWSVSKGSVTPSTAIKEMVERLGAKELDDLSYRQKVAVFMQAFPANRFVILPTSKIAQRTNFLLALALVYTVTVTPYEVAFLNPRLGVIFGLNRVVDIIFLLDTVVSFFRAYRTVNEKGSFWETDLGRIRVNYLKTNFLIDMITLGCSSVEIAAICMIEGNWRNIQLIRTMRTLRLIRMAALFKLTELVERMCTWFDLSFQTIELTRTLFMFLTSGHLMACIFGLTGVLCEQAGYTTWIQGVENTLGATIGRDNGELYLFSLYWAAVTLASVGYGDVTPKCIPEYWVVLFLILFGSSVWIYTSSVVIGVVSAMDAERLEHGQRASTLDELCNEYNVDQDLRRQLHDFLLHSRRVRRLESFDEVFGRISPSLRRKIEFFCRNHYVRRIWWTNKCEDGFISVLMKSLNHAFYSPNEWIVPDHLTPFVSVTMTPPGLPGDSQRLRRMSRTFSRATALGDLSDDGSCHGGLLVAGILTGGHYAPLTILEKGLVVLHMAVNHAYWHEDVILSQPKLRDPEVARSFSFCSVHTLVRKEIFKAFHKGHFSRAREALKWAAVRIAMQRLMRSAGIRAMAMKNKEPNANIDIKEAVTEETKLWKPDEPHSIRVAQAETADVRSIRHLASLMVDSLATIDKKLDHNQAELMRMHSRISALEKGEKSTTKSL